MKEMRRLLSFLLVLAMVVGFVPATAFAAEVSVEFTGSSTAATDYLFFATDRHGNETIIGKLLTQMGADKIEYVGLGGDMDGSGGGSSANPEYNVNVILGEVTAAAPHLTNKDVDLVYASGHDQNAQDPSNTGIMNWESGELYEGDHYYVYGVIQDDVEGATAAQSAAADFVAWATNRDGDGKDIDTSKVIIVLSHFPLHAQRGDNKGAGYWHNALNTVATGSATGRDVVRDVVFFHGHNHTTEGNTTYLQAPKSSLKIESYVTPSATMAASLELETFTMQVLDPELELQEGMTTNATASGTTSTIYYTYATAGYLKAHNKATMVTITEDSLSLQGYSTSGATSNSLSLERVETVAAVTPTNLVVTGGNEYTVGDVFTMPTVSVNYNDGTSATLTESQYTVTGAPAVDATGKLTTAGEYTLTYSCTLNGYAATAEFKVTIEEPTVTDIRVVKNKGTYQIGEELDITVYLKYSNDTEVEITDYTVTGFDSETAGTKNVFVKYGDFTYTFTVKVVEESAEPVLNGLKVTYTKETLVGQVLNLKVYALYDDGSSVELTEGYTVSGYDPAATGAQGVIVTYQTQSYGFNVIKHAETDVTVLTDGMNSLSVTDVTETLTEALADDLAEGFVAYDIVPDNYNVENSVAVVSMPAPEGANAVYYWNAETEALEPVSDFTIENGKAVFTTDHFSTYVAGQAAVPGNTVVVENVPFTTITTKEETVYKLVTTTPVSGKQYLIVNSNNGDGYGLDGDTTGYNTDTFTGGEGYYSAWDETTNTGTAFAAGSDVYLTTTGAYLWTAGSNTFTIKYDRSSGSNSYTYTLDPANGDYSGTWNLSSNRLSISLKRYTSNWNDDTRTYYLSGGSTWSMSTSAANVYFYEPVTLTKVTEDTTTQDVTVGINITVNGTAASTMEAKNLVAGDTLTLGTAFTSNPTGYTPAGGNYTWEVTSDENDVITSVEDGVVTFTGEVGTGTVKVSYTWSVNGTSYTVSNTLAITTTAQSYSLAFSSATTNVERGVPKTLPLVAKNADGKTVRADGVTWSVDDPSVLTVKDGVATGLVVGGKTTVTAKWTDPNGVEHTAQIEVTVVEREPDYTLDILDTNGNIIDWVISLEKVTETTNKTYDLGVKVTKDGVAFDIDSSKVQYVSYATRTDTENKFVPQKGTLYWTVNDDGIVTSIDANGLVTFSGTKDGLVNVSVYYCGTDSSEWLYDTVTITVTSQDYYTTDDGSQYFPEYPNPGSVNINKTATAVGDFSKTGIAQIELYGNGVPVKSGGYADVTIMLDDSTSMKSQDITDTQNATIALLRALFFDKGATEYTEDTFNENHGHRVYLGYYKGTGSSSIIDITTDEVDDTGNVNFQLVGSFDEYEELVSSLTSKYVLNSSSRGTEWDYSLEKCYDILYAAKNAEQNYDRKQFCVFMSDGAPTVYRYATSSGSATTSLASDGAATSDWVTSSTVSGSTVYSRNSSYQYEYWSTKMKSDNGMDVTVYTVLLNETAAQPMFLMNDIAGSGTETTSQRDTGATMSKQYVSEKNDFSDIEENDYFFSVTSANASKMTTVFSAIGEKINAAAATDVVIHDQITDAYELILDFPQVMIDYDADPNNSYTNPIPNQEFYIEVVNYKLDASYNRTGEVETLIRIYIDDQGAYYKENGEDKRYDSYDAETGEGVTVTFGTDGKVGNIFCKYFTYNAATKSFTWKTDQLSDTHQIALRYFVYLSESLEKLYDGNNDTQLPAQPYETNTIAWIEYKNADENLCRKEFPVPQLTWNGAQVTYVFYLVNDDGLPVNKAGQRVDFSNSIEVTQRYTEYVVWNGEMGVTSLDVELLASEKLPEYYSLYDSGAYFEVHVYQNELAQDAGDNYFQLTNTLAINGNDDGKDDTDYTTKVFMDKSSTKYDATGYYTKDGGQFVDADGKTVSSSLAASGFDFADLTVAFAVVWTPELQDDVVVVDFGLDVIIDVTTNDYLDNNIHGISTDDTSYSGVTINTSHTEDATKAFAQDDITLAPLTVHIEGAKTLRVHQNSMEFNAPVKFYYDSEISYVKNEGTANEETVTGYMYSSVTVIPATTVYYEDSFLTLESYTDNVKDDPTKWAVEGTTINGTQDTDRPGDSKISFEIDADNVYGYDSAYTEMSEYSMGSAAMIHVDANSYGTAGFTFYGTGFDVISETSNMTGTIAVTVEDASGTIVKRTIVDTYYGYMLDPDNYDKITYTYWGVDENGNEKWSVATEVVTKAEAESDVPPEKPDTDLVEGESTYYVYKQRWITTTNDPNAVHQVPVIKIFGLPYGQYTATLTATYNSFFDHTGTENEDGSKDGYDLYLDAIRIYDPAGTNKEANDAYIKDNEGYPVYKELRNMILDKGSFSVDANGNFTVPDNGVLGGMVFIDSNNATNVISDYTNYGPNNELYLAPGQAIAFNLNLTTDAMNALVDVQIGLKLANGANAAYEVYNVLAGGAQYKPMAGVAKTATEMYYSISDLRNGTIVIRNSGDAGILSVTNLKFTFKSQQTAEIAKETADGAKQVVVTNGEATTNAVKSLSYVTPSTPNFDPEAMDITFNRTNAEVGNNVIVTVTTSSDVKDLIVNGTVATNKMTSYLTGETTWSFTVPVVDNGSLKVTVVGYDANGEYTVPYSETVTVINMSGNQSDLLGKLFG